MSHTADLGRAVHFAARAATFRTVFDFIRASADTNSELRNLLDRQIEFDAVGHWDFGSLSMESFRVLRQILSDIARDPAAAASSWNPKRRGAFVSDIDEFRKNLEDRLALGEAAE